MSNTHILLLLCWVAFYALHSFFASKGVKQQLAKGRYYRLIYSIASTVGLLPMLFLLQKEGGNKFYASSLLVEAVALMLIVAGVVTVYRSFRYFSVRVFLGLQESQRRGVLIQEGLHKWVRHPIYSGTLLVFVGAFLMKPTLGMLISLIVTVCYIPVGIRLEESKLIEEYGTEYKHYKQNVPALCPRLFF